ncbi:MAG: hypothetical protein ACU0AX_05150 [Roseovarius sp.]|uniref:hypothetical protein n=1 Tax=Roseovarius sp. TaxID=1486281 RepID=UPI004058ABB8
MDKIVDLIFLENAIVERYLTQDLYRILVRRNQRRTLRAANEKMHLDIFGGTNFDSRKVTKPTACLVLDVVCVREIEGKWLVDMPATVLPSMPKIDSIGASVDTLGLQRDLHVLIVTEN